MQPDTIVLGAANPQAFNRYSYVLNNPIRYNDPTGHMCSDPEDESPTCDGSFLQSTKVGNKIVKGSGLDAGKPKNKPKKDVGNVEDLAPTAPPTIDVQDLFLQYPGFDPFTGTYSNPNDYYGSGAEDIDLAFLALYDTLGIDIDYYAIHGLPNPLSLDQVPTEMQIRLIGPAQSIPLTFFLRELGLMTPDITTNYEPNYVYIAMLSHPDALVRAIDIYNTDVAPLTDKLQNLGPGDPPSP